MSGGELLSLPDGPGSWWYWPPGLDPEPVEVRTDPRPDGRDRLQVARVGFVGAVLAEALPRGQWRRREVPRWARPGAGAVRA